MFLGGSPGCFWFQRSIRKQKLRVDRLWLMHLLSSMRVPVLPVLSARSLPARSTKDILPQKSSLVPASTMSRNSAKLSPSALCDCQQRTACRNQGGEAEQAMRKDNPYVRGCIRQDAPICPGHKYAGSLRLEAQGSKGIATWGLTVELVGDHGQALGKVRGLTLFPGGQVCLGDVFHDRHVEVDGDHRVRAR